MENTNNNSALIAIIYNNPNSYQNLSDLIKSLSKWNRLFYDYSKLIKSKLPNDVKLISIQEGSIEFVFNINLDLAINLTEIIKYGLITFGVFSSYQKIAKPIIDSFLKKDKPSEAEEVEKLIYSEVCKSIENRIKEQLKIDSSIINEDKRIKNIAEIAAEHIVEGNDLKLLSQDNIDNRGIVGDKTKSKTNNRTRQRNNNSTGIYN